MNGHIIASTMYGLGSMTSSSNYATNTITFDQIKSDFTNALGVPVIPTSHAGTHRKPDTNLEWLDRRVDEMRVKL